MSTRLGPVLAEFAEGRWPDERRMNPRAFDLREMDLRAVEPRDMDHRDLDPRALEPPLHPSELDRFERERARVGRWVPVALIRFMIVFFVGVLATLAWQSYGNAARRMMASWSPRLAWLLPPAAPALPAVATPAAAASPDQLTAISRSLAAVRQSVDRLAADVGRLQTTGKQESGPMKTSAPPASPPVPVVVSGRKSAPR